MFIWRLIDSIGTEAMPGMLMQLAAIAAVMLFCLPVHEFAHAWAAHKLGDDTAKNQGRLTLDPFKHLDFFGTLLLFIIGVGYAKPVPVNPRNMNYRRFKRRGQQNAWRWWPSQGR